MNHLPHLIQDLGLILIVAGITTLIFKWLKQPLVLGYLLAGLLVSPNFALFPTVTDLENIRIWADIGVIFLLFNLGLEFSFKKLMRVGGPASISALIEVSFMLAIGFALGKFMGWSSMDSMFLGGILSVASTTIIIRSFDELGVKGKRFANLVFGILIVEDLVAIVLMVLLSTIAVSRQFEGMEMLLSVLKLAFFLVLWFVGGIFFIPSFLHHARKLMNDETMLVVSIGLCLMMVILASMVGFSPALGAFIMGSILAETTQGERIERLIKPVKDLFGAVFFVSVGMLINPALLYEYALPVLIISVLFVIFKTFNVTLGALVSGQPLKTSLYAGMSMAQIGEFSFIIATLGLTLGVTSNFLYPIAVAVSAITTFTTPYMIRLSQPLYKKIESVLPPKWKKVLTRYSVGARTISSASNWRLILRSYFLYILILSIVILGIILLFSGYISPWADKYIDNATYSTLITAAACFLIISPFLWALMVRKLQPQAFADLWAEKRYRGPLMFLRLMRGAIGVLYISIYMLSFFPLTLAGVGVFLLVLVSGIFSKRIHSFYLRIEERFFFNLHHREMQEAKASRSELAPWDAHIAQFVLPMGTPVTGMTLEEMALRERLGVNIAMIRRGDYFISAPGRNERVYPGDKLFVIGNDDQLENFRNHILPSNGLPDRERSHEVVLKKITVGEYSILLDKSIKESGIREKTNGLVVGIERGGKRILNPESTTVFQIGDKVWIVGIASLIKELDS